MLGKQRGNSTIGVSSKNRTSSSALGTTSKFGKQTSSSPDGIFSVPLIKVNDNAKYLPKYTIALQRSPEDSLQPDDLDAVQLELELLLSTVALRYRMLKSEYETLDKAEDRKEREKKNKYLEKQPPSPGKKKKLDEKLKFKDSKYTNGQIKLPKTKSNLSNTEPSSLLQTDDSMDGVSSHNLNTKDNQKLTVLKNDTPSRFWLSVEPYCMPITHEDIKLLDDLIEEYSGSLVPSTPELGQYYTTKWALEDLKNEQDNSNPNAKARSRNINSNQNDVLGLLKNGEKLMGENITGPLTQRLVSALMEENLISDNDKNFEPETENQSNNRMGTGSAMKNGISIERRVKQELIEHGFLDPEDFNEQDDEILVEIKRVRTELSAIAEYNCTELKKLHTAAKEEISRLEVKRKLDAIDQEIIETYKKLSAAKQKRRPITKQERDDVFRLTEEQKKLSDLLELMPLPGNFNPALY